MGVYCTHRMTDAPKFKNLPLELQLHKRMKTHCARKGLKLRDFGNTLLKEAFNKLNKPQAEELSKPAP